MKRTKQQPTPANNSVSPKAGDGVPAIEVNDTANKGYWFRIIKGDAVGQWSGYTGIATLKCGDTVYLAATDYFHGSLPTNQVFTTRTIT